MTKGGEKYQANPYYGQECLARQHWAIIAKKTRKIGGGYTEEEIPVHLQCIVYINETPMDRITLDLQHSIEKKGYYFLANTINRELNERGANNEEWGREWNYGTLADNNQTLIHMATKKKVEYTVATNTASRMPAVKERDAVIIFPVGTVKSGVVGVLDPNYK